MQCALDASSLGHSFNIVELAKLGGATRLLALGTDTSKTGSNKLEDINVTFSRYNRKLAYLTTAQSATYTHAIVVYTTEYT